MPRAVGTVRYPPRATIKGFARNATIETMGLSCRETTTLPDQWRSVAALCGCQVSSSNKRLGLQPAFAPSGGFASTVVPSARWERHQTRPDEAHALEKRTRTMLRCFAQRASPSQRDGCILCRGWACQIELHRSHSLHPQCVAPTRNAPSLVLGKSTRIRRMPRKNIVSSDPVQR